MIDLHSHTTASDGSLSPRELVELAKRTGISTLGVTDHDTVDGIGEATLAGQEQGVEILPGLEFSAEYEPGTMHLLAYGIDVTHRPLLEELSARRDQRDERNPKIVEALRGLGFDITIEEVMAAAGGKVIGRPHIGKVLVAKGHASSVSDAFARYLDKGGPAFVKQQKIAPRRAIELTVEAGGVPTLAHPYQTKLAGDALESLVRELVEQGLQGIEVYYSRHTPEMTGHYRSLARKFDLIETGGSDFHGTPKPDIKLGTGVGNLRVPPEVLTSLRERQSRIVAGRLAVR
jgi:predicted metal-dependent phosphoesterase TrpH